MDVGILRELGWQLGSGVLWSSLDAEDEDILPISGHQPQRLLRVTVLAKHCFRIPWRELEHHGPGWSLRGQEKGSGKSKSWKRMKRQVPLGSCLPTLYLCTQKNPEATVLSAKSVPAWANVTCISDQCINSLEVGLNCRAWLRQPPPQHSSSVSNPLLGWLIPWTPWAPLMSPGHPRTSPKLTLLLTLTWTPVIRP